MHKDVKYMHLLKKFNFLFPFFFFLKNFFYIFAAEKHSGKIKHK